MDRIESSARIVPIDRFTLPRRIVDISNEFNISLVFTLGKPHLRNMAVGMYSFQGEFSFDWTGFAAGTAISVIPVLLVFFAFQNYFVRGMAGAVKG